MRERRHDRHLYNYIYKSKEAGENVANRERRQWGGNGWEVKWEERDEMERRSLQKQQTMACTLPK